MINKETNRHPRRELAAGWQWVKLKTVAEVISGQHILELDYNTNGCGIGYLTGPADFGTVKPKITKWTEKPKVTCEPLDVLVTVKGAGVGKINLSPDVTVAIGRQLMAVRVHYDSLDTMFLFRFLTTCFGHFQGSAMGATVPGLSRDDLEMLPVPLPPLAEQRRIAGVLHDQMETVEKARAAADAQLAAVKNLPVAFLRQVFPQPDQPLPTGWRWEKLGEMCDRIDYGYTASADFDVKTLKFLRITDIQNNKVNWDSVPGCAISEADEDANRLEDGDIVFARTGATTGKSYLISKPPRSVFASYLIRVKSHKDYIKPDYLYAFFQSDAYWKQISAGARGGAQPGFNATMLAALNIPLPPLSEQRRIAVDLKERMKSMDNAHTAADEELKAVDALPAALLRRAFYGEI
jgi:type I restriction enzyme S subunit